MKNILWEDDEYMKKLKVWVFIIAVTVLVIGFGIITNAAGGSINTSEFGTFTYSLTGPSPTTVNALTSITRYTSNTRVIVKLDIRNNSTGELIYSRTQEEVGAPLSSITTAIYENYTLAAFSTHEARGNGTVVKYLAEVF